LLRKLRLGKPAWLLRSEWRRPRRSPQGEDGRCFACRPAGHSLDQPRDV